MTETTAANPELLADQVANLLVQPLEAASVVLSSGPRIFDTSGVLRIPKLVSGSTPTFVGEGQLIPDTADVDFDELVLMPTERKSIKTILKYTNELVRQSVLGIDAVLKARLVKDVSDALDDALLKGTGTSDTITGFINQPNVQTSDWDPTDPDSLMDAIGLAVAAEANPNRWFINGADFIKLRKVKENNSGSKKYVLESDLTKDATYRLFGLEVVVTNKLAEGQAVLADMSQVAIARDIAPSVTVLTERYAEFDQVGLRVVTRYDLGLLHPEGVIVLDTDGS
ncbi:phage major capsid protein [Mycobacterium sp. GA-2829]|uniref:phage major capsid protein n=1 Tax=Mycobacterium sp. GA-2829 TaxID=1772283 RepID=UPI00073FE363|nr:phage major capsid protein [Mycobacterium sp. GA-2829]KUI27755.1 capsid protein [Mycobacterium sp. GA-2829]